MNKNHDFFDRKKSIYICVIRNIQYEYALYLVFICVICIKQCVWRAADLVDFDLCAICSLCSRFPYSPHQFALLISKKYLFSRIVSTCFV